MNEPDDDRGYESVVASAYAELAAIDSSAGALAQAEGLRRAEDLIELYGLVDWQPTQTWIARIRLRRAMFLSRLDEDDRALAALDELVQWYALSGEPTEREVAADAMLGRADLWEFLGRVEDQRTGLRELVARFGDSDHPGIQHTVALAQLRLLRSADTAEGQCVLFDALQRAHGEPGDGPRAGVVLTAAQIYVDALSDLDRRDQARAFVDQTWMRYRSARDLGCQRELGLLRLKALRLPGSVNVAGGASEVIEWLAPVQSEYLIIDVAAAARVRKASALRADGDLDAALTVVEELLSTFADTTDPATMGHLAWAQIEQGLLLRRLGRKAEAAAALRSTRRFLDAPGDRDFLRLKVAEAYDHVADLRADDTPPPIDQRQGKDGVTVASEAEAVTQRPLDDSEVAYAAAVEELADVFDSDEDPRIQRLVANALSTLANHQRHRLHLDAALATYQRLTDRYIDAADHTVEQEVARGMMNAAFVQMVLLRRFEDAMSTYNAIIERYGNHTSAAMRDILAKVSSSRVACANHLTRAGHAVSYGSEHELIRPEELKAAKDRQDEAIAAEERGDHEAAVAALDRILAAHGESTHPEWRRRSLDALVRKAWSLKQLGRAVEAIAVCDDAVGRYGADLAMDMEKDIARLLAYKTVELDKLGRHEEELATYDEIIRRWSSNSVADLRKKVANARLCKGITLKDLGRHEEAITAYQQALVHAGDELVEIARDGVTAANNLGILLRKLGRPADAIGVHQLALRHARRDDPKLQAQAGLALVGLGRAHAALGHHDDAIAAIDQALAMPPGTLKDSVREGIAQERAALMRSKQPAGLFRRLFSRG